jgi:hypothetical protein
MQPKLSEARQGIHWTNVSIHNKASAGRRGREPAWLLTFAEVKRRADD